MVSMGFMREGCRWKAGPDAVGQTNPSTGCPETTLRHFQAGEGRDRHYTRGTVLKQESRGSQKLPVT